MQIPEWYTGTDRTGKVAAGIERVIERMDQRSADDSDIRDLQELLALEQEINWRSFLLGLMGTIHYDLEEIDSAKGILEESVAAYKAYLETFDEVLSVYCQSCYTLGVILFDDGHYGEAVPFFLRCLPYMHEVYDETYIGHIYTFLALCLSWTTQTGYSVVFSEAAAFTRRWRHRQGHRCLPPPATSLPGLRELRPSPGVCRTEPRRIRRRQLVHLSHRLLAAAGDISGLACSLRIHVRVLPYLIQW
jgi:tetratricopeptide (TPR) repeat protein